jgi:hypothetical protein
MVGATEFGNQNEFTRARQVGDMSVPLKTRAMLLRLGRNGPFWIAAGIAGLLAACCWPHLPVLTGMSLVALGATLEGGARYGQVSRLRPLIAVHAVVYANLYLVFVGAVCHAALTGPRHGLSWTQGIDLLVSVAPMVVAGRLAFAALAGGGARAAR